MATIDDVRALGYDVGLAQGSVHAEERALSGATELAAPDKVQEDADPLVQQATADALRLIDSDPGFHRLTTDQQIRFKADIVARINTQVPRMLSEHRNAAVELYTRSVEIARRMPNVWHVSGPTVPGIYVSTKEDGTGWDDSQQSIIDALCDPDGHHERTFQADNPQATEAILALNGAGYDVQRAKPRKDLFDITSTDAARSQVAEKAQTPDQVVAIAEELPDVAFEGQ
jgi:hypothetical protein